MEKLAAGTRCECRDGCIVVECRTMADVAKTPKLTHSCGVKAVRLVTVERMICVKGEGVFSRGPERIPMCAACAEHHEAKARA